MEHIVSQLITKRKEFEGEYLFHKKKLATLEELLNATNLLIRAFNPLINLEEIKPKRYTGRKRYFKKGESHKMILDLFRIKQEPMKTTEITKTLMKKKNLNYDDQEILDNVQKSVLHTLKRMQETKLIQSIHKDSLNGFTWELCS